MEDSEAVAALSTQLAQRIGPQRFELWFHNQAELCARANCLTIRAASPFVRDWLQKNFADDIRACWVNLVDGAATVEFELAPATACDLGATNAHAAKKPQPEQDPPADSKKSKKRRPTAASSSDGSAINSTPALPAEPAGARNAVELAQFVVGRSNEYAFRAAELTGRGRQQASPLLLCGPTGVGKTHLLRGIAREYRRHHPRLAAVYMSAEQFTTSFVEAIRGSGLPSFRQKCRGARLLVIDDLQFFAGKQRTLEELLHTFDTMCAEGRQLVLASDRPLGDLRALGSELISRLSGGLICEIEPPEYATRLSILRRICDEAALTVEDTVLSLVAQQITEGARELRGLLHRLEAMSDAYGEPISHELASRALGDLARHSTRSVRLADVQKAVCHVFGLEPAQLRSERKGRSVSEPRMLAMWLARKYTPAPWSEIGEFFGRRSHSTVISAHRRVEKLITSQAQIGVADRSCNVEDAIRRVETALRTA